MPQTTKERLFLCAGSLVVLSGLGVLFFFAPDQHSFYPRCWFYALTGLRCPGCGMLRATHHLLHGDIVGAFHLNQLFVLLLPVVFMHGVACVVKKITGNDYLRIISHLEWGWPLLLSALLFGILRNLALS